jgi:cytosine/adenosine deaminase-related metal-dependent hydrolase
MATVLSADWVLPVDGEPIEGGAIAIEDGRIAAVGTVEQLGRGRHFAGAAIAPALVNAHSHLEYAVYTGFGDGLHFAPWISLHMERKRTLSFGDMLAIARLGAAECLASGIGTVADASFSGAAALAAADLGLRAIVGLEIFGSDAERALAHFERLRALVEPALSERVRLAISPHAPYTTTLDLYRAARELRLPVLTHLAESFSERPWLEHGSGYFAQLAELLVPPPGASGIRHLAANGLLGPETIAAHCVDLEPDEIELLAANGVAVAHCPRSNGYLGCGFAPLTALRAAGVRVGIGTDSPASAPSFDLFEELRTAIVVARAREHGSDTLTARDALRLATLDGARALGLEHEVGSLSPGKQADLVIVALSETSLVPWEDPAAALVLGGSPSAVLATYVEGRPRYERGELDWHELRNAAASARGRMLAAGRPPSAS